jgi:hypothetical protein
MRGVREEDIAIQENLYGPIADRTKEHLGTSDAGVIALRRRLLKAMRNLQAGREPPESPKWASIRYAVAISFPETSPSMTPAALQCRSLPRDQQPNMSSGDKRRCTMYRRLITGG